MEEEKAKRSGANAFLGIPDLLHRSLAPHSPKISEKSLHHFSVS